eukprot:scaffold26911_cov67-Phaeocystis_antarctica.AAC.1
MGRSDVTHQDVAWPCRCFPWLVSSPASRQIRQGSRVKETVAVERSVIVKEHDWRLAFICVIAASWRPVATLAQEYDMAVSIRWCEMRKPEPRGVRDTKAKRCKQRGRCCVGSSCDAAGFGPNPRPQSSHIVASACPRVPLGIVNKNLQSRQPSCRHRGSFMSNSGRSACITPRQRRRVGLQQINQWEKHSLSVVSCRGLRQVNLAFIRNTMCLAAAAPPVLGNIMCLAAAAPPACMPSRVEPEQQQGD